jgi:hypothetical protein
MPPGFHHHHHQLCCPEPEKSSEIVPWSGQERLGPTLSPGDLIISKSRNESNGTCTHPHPINVNRRAYPIIVPSSMLRPLACNASGLLQIDRTSIIHRGSYHQHELLELLFSRGATPSFLLERQRVIRAVSANTCLAPLWGCMTSLVAHLC